MNETDEIEVSISKDFANPVRFLIIISLLIPTIATLISKKLQIGLYILFSIIILMCFVSLMWITRTRICFTGDEVSVQRTIGRRKKYLLSDIEKIVWKRNKTRLMLNENMTIKFKKTALSIDNSMVGFEEAAAFIKERVPSSKIEYIDKEFK